MSVFRASAEWYKTRIAAQEKRQAENKYKNRPTGGYSSAKEARRAAELKLLQHAGKIRNLEEQVPYVLIPAQSRDGVTERAAKYVADFRYEELMPDESWKPVVEDAKGYKDGPAYKLFVIKRKLMLLVHGIAIKET